MILDNLASAFKTQNWFAVATEFVIVIAGVVIGFQINAWNEHRSETQRLQVQLSAVAGEMRGNLAALDRRQASLEGKLDLVNEIRRGFIDPEIAAQIDLEQILSVFGVEVMALQNEALSDLESLPIFRREGELSLIEAIHDWKALVAVIVRVEQDAVSNRDTYAISWIVEYPGFADLVAQSGRAGEGFARGRIQARFDDFVDDPRFEGVLLLRYLNSDTLLRLVTELEVQTQALIDELEAA